MIERDRRKEITIDKNKSTLLALILAIFLLGSCSDEAVVISEFQDCEDCPVMVVLPKGEFIMGGRENYKYLHKNQLPLQKINIGYSFAVGKYEVSWSDFHACFREGGCARFPYRLFAKGQDGEIPMKSKEYVKIYGKYGMGRVSWDMIQEYIDWLSKKTGRKYRLLSESEWEYAARGGTETEFWWGDSVKPGYAICSDCPRQVSYIVSRHF